MGCHLEAGFGKKHRLINRFSCSLQATPVRRSPKGIWRVPIARVLSSQAAGLGKKMAPASIPLRRIDLRNARGDQSDFSTLLANAAFWNSSRICDPSALGKLVRWVIKIIACPATGSIQACVP